MKNWFGDDQPKYQGADQWPFGDGKEQAEWQQDQLWDSWNPPSSPWAPPDYGNRSTQYQSGLGAEGPNYWIDQGGGWFSAPGKGNAENGFWQQGIDANQQRWPNPFGDASGDLRKALWEQGWHNNPQYLGMWAGQHAYEAAAPGIEYGLPQAYQQLGGILSQRGALDPGQANQEIAQLGQQAMMDQHALQAQLADAGMGGSEMGTAQMAGIDAGRQAAQAGAYGDHLNRQEAQYRDDLQRAYGMLMGFPMQLFDTGASQLLGGWQRDLARGDRDMQEYAAIMNAVGGAAGADWSSLWQNDRSQLSQEELENLQTSVGTGF